jgi:hypothetical protein
MTDVTDKQYDIDTLARTLYGEAEPNNKAEAEAIASVVMNRLHNPRWHANSAAAVCLQPLQFSCWNATDRNRERILKASDSWFAQCQRTAERAVQDCLDDRTRGATHYYLDSMPCPHWAKGHEPCYQILHKNGTTHLFFNDIDTKAPVTKKDALDQERPLHTTRTMKAGTVAGASALTSVVADLTDVKTNIAPLADYSHYIQTALVVLTLVCVGLMIWARYDDRKKGKR